MSTSSLITVPLSDLDFNVNRIKKKTAASAVSVHGNRRKKIPFEKSGSTCVIKVKKSVACSYSVKTVGTENRLNLILSLITLQKCQLVLFLR